MGFFSWLGSLFGGKKKTKIPSKVVEYRSRQSSTAKTERAPGEHSYERAASSEDVAPSSSGGGRDMFELAGDRAAKKVEQARVEQTIAPPPPPPPPVETGFAGAPSFEQKPAAPVEEPVIAPPPPVTSAPPVEEDYSPLDLAREIQGATTATAPPPPQPGEPVFHPDAAYAPTPQQHYGQEETAEPVEEKEPEEPTFTLETGAADSNADLESLGVKFETGFTEPSAPVTVPEPEPVATPEAVTEIKSEPKPVETAEPKPEPKPKPAPPADDDPDARMLDRLKDQTVEGSGTVTIERKRIETKSINIGGENFDIALYEYQNGTRAARVPRAAIERMTEIAKQNNLKVLPRKQNAAIMAGRFLGVSRAELQERAEKEKYSLVDFTDIYYEICFGELPE